ncbi:MAG: hypothetical protein MUW56_06905 [Chryseobacterium sp.]|uniref:hypothetical protein n=1 Tax=Chryseobacterium sp. TaxID=1871047 RepID=UPI0025BCA2C8|nr:hypothetical protein [Chryseobacterium sp.]MCJ7933362.1 hypothetical protein [Chryseobacterium sp.]
MIELIRENKFEEVKELLKNLKELQIHAFLLEILEGKTVHADENSFAPEKYQIEFTEGVQLYKTLEKSELDRELLAQFVNILVELAFTMGLYIQDVSLTAMNQGAYLTDSEHIYKVDPEIRLHIQELINILKNKPEQEKAIANLSTAKAKVTHSIDNILEKYEVGEDMLQLAETYGKAGQTETAAQIYLGIMTDFECDSVRQSSGLVPEMTHVDDRPETEIAVFNKAKINFEEITGQKIQEPNRIHVKESKDAESLVRSVIEAAQEQTEGEVETEDQDQKEHLPEVPSQANPAKPGLLAKIKRIFTKN